MKKPVKVIIVWLIMSVIIIIGGQYIGSYFYSHISGHDVPLGLTTLLQLHKITNGKLLTNIHYVLAVVISVLPFIVITFMLFIVGFKKPKRELHGSAKFANPIDIRKAKLLESKYDEPDILIGQYKGKYLRWSGNEFCSLAAPTRSGKGVGIVIPNCLHYRDSLVVFDPKLENFRITAGYRHACGQKIFLFNPSSREFRSHRWNPMHYVSRNPNQSHSDVSEIASILLAPTGKNADPFWSGMAQQLFVGLGLYLIEKEKELNITPTITEIIRLAQPVEQTLKQWIENVVLDPTLSDNCKSGLKSYSENSTNTMSSIISSLIEPLSIFNDPVVQEVTSGNDFDFRDLRKERMTIYLGIQLADLASGRFDRLNNLFFSQLIYQNLREDPTVNPELKYQCLLLMDEFTSLGNLPVMEKGVAYVAGFNIRFLLIYQNNAQLNTCYDENGARTLLTNIACQIMYTPADINDAEEYSKTIGYETYKSRSKSVGGKGGGSGGSTISPNQRALLLPQELLEYPKDECIIKLQARKPIRANKIFYYKDPNFIKRLKYPLPEIPLTPKGVEEQSKMLSQAQKERQTAEAAGNDTFKDTSKLEVFLHDALIGQSDDPIFKLAVKQATSKAVEFMDMNLIDALSSVLQGNNIDLLSNT